MKIDLSRFRATFVEEAREHVAAFERGLLELRRAGPDGELLGSLFRAVHSVKGSSGMFGLTEVGAFSHAIESVLGVMRDGALAPSDAIVDLLLRCSDHLARQLDAAERDEPAPPGQAELEAALEGLRTNAAPPPANVPGTAKAPTRAVRQESLRLGLGDGSMRVATARVDELVDLAGELAIAQSAVTRAVEAGDGTEHVAEVVAAVTRNVLELQERVLAVRMLPLEHLFARLPRLVHDLCVACGKEVELRTSGEETELDRGVIERLADPLTHLMRNAIDHGIESAAERLKAGKSAVGAIRVCASYDAGSVQLEVADDGRGLDREAIVERAIQLGLVRGDQPLSEREADALIFEPGLSTAGAVTDVSGRGIGAEVVRRNVEALNGTVSVSSVPGLGTAFLLRLPLTLSLLEGLQLRVGTRHYILPLIAIEECFRPAPDQLHRLPDGGEALRLRGEPLPLLRLHRLLDVDPASSAEGGVVVLLANEGVRFGLLVDELLDPAQVVIKSLETNYRRVEGILGATILGDGSVSLILDVGGLTRIARRTRVRHGVAPTLMAKSAAL